MNIRITPRPLSGVVRAISSKSDAHRLLIAAALSDAPTLVALSDTNEDIAATAACLKALGAGIAREQGDIMVNPIRGGCTAPLLDCVESGSTLRFLLPVAMALKDEVTFTGKGRLPQRPLTPLLAQMQQNGCTFSSSTLPFTATGRLQAGRYELAGNVSSQFVSGLLLALPLLEGDSQILLTSMLESRPYVEMTLHTLRSFGVEIAVEQNAFGVRGSQVYRSPGRVEVEGDWSGAAFFLCAGALGKTVTVEGLAQDSLQADKAIVPLLARFGAVVAADKEKVTVSPGPLRALEADVSQCPDLFPLLAVLAAGAEGETRLVGAKRLRLKESDRISAVASMLLALGGRVEEHQDGLTIQGSGALLGGVVDSAGDHRIAMAAAVASILAKQEVLIIGAECCAKSYPGFFEDFNALGGKADVV